MKKENKTLDLAVMPAAVSENTPQDGFGLNLANRRCSERRTVSRSLRRRTETTEGKRRFTRCSTEGWSRNASKRSRNRQVEGKGFRAGTNRLTGPDAGKMAGR